MSWFKNELKISGKKTKKNKFTASFKELNTGKVNWLKQVLRKENKERDSERKRERKQRKMFNSRIDF